MTYRMPRAPALAAAGLCLVASAAVGQTPTADDACGWVPSIARGNCRAAFDLLASASREPRHDLRVFVTAEADRLSFRYEPAGDGEGCKATGPLALPVGRRVMLTFTSGDDHYTWRVPHLGLSVDLVLGRLNSTSLDVRAAPERPLGSLTNESSGRETPTELRLVEGGALDPRSLCGG
jgi:heme/copper-type cytochrome/quinol oxidase subunit 2